MSDNIQNIAGRDCFAFTGARSEIWHRKGQQMAPDATRVEWDHAAGHDFEVVKVPAIAQFTGAEFDHFDAANKFAETEWFFMARRDNGHVFAPVTKTYQPVQPRDVDDWFEEYISHDPRFHKDASGALGDGEKIWTTARFESDFTVAGDKIIPRLLMSTSFDATMATRNEATTTRVVCENTLRAAHMSDKAVIKTSHRTAFDGARVRRELAQIVQSFEAFKAMGDAMAQVSAPRDVVAKFFRDLLDIPMDAARKDISTRKLNMVDDLGRAVATTMRERNASNDPDLWCLLNGVTRYVDHDRTVRTDSGARDVTAARFDAGTFGSGDAMKGKAMGLLLPMLPQRALQTA
jgi:phage/plasmid-like protein (TIGR03299 family)